MPAPTPRRLSPPEDRRGLPFDHGAVLGALTKLIGRIRPATVYAPHPDERHADHRAAAWFTIEALQELVREGVVSPNGTTVRVDQFYSARETPRAPCEYRSHLLHATGDAMARVQEAYWFYQTQGGNHARGRVLAWDELQREHHLEIVDWNEHQGWNSVECG